MDAVVKRLKRARPALAIIAGDTDDFLERLCCLSGDVDIDDDGNVYYDYDAVLNGYCF